MPGQQAQRGCPDLQNRLQSARRKAFERWGAKNRSVTRFKATNFLGNSEPSAEAAIGRVSQIRTYTLYREYLKPASQAAAILNNCPKEPMCQMRDEIVFKRWCRCRGLSARIQEDAEMYTVLLASRLQRHSRGKAYLGSAT